MPAVKDFSAVRAPPHCRQDACASSVSVPSAGALRFPSAGMKEQAQVAAEGASMRVWTVGHSTRSAEEFGRILAANRIECLVDVRSFPGSRRYPHFNRPDLALNLKAVGIGYSHLPELGGRRRPSPDSKNTAWQNASFRAYADHLETAEFEKGVDGLLDVASASRTALMCAEALWWRCHRSLIADYLKANGVEVIHILDANKIEIHPYTSAARLVEGRLSYEGLLLAEER